MTPFKVTPDEYGRSTYYSESPYSCATLDTEGNVQSMNLEANTISTDFVLFVCPGACHEASPDLLRYVAEYIENQTTDE